MLCHVFGAVGAMSSGELVLEMTDQRLTTLGKLLVASLLVVWPGAPSSVLAPSSDGLCS